MRIPGLARIEDGTSASTKAITDAIDLAGAYLAIARPHHRRHDLPMNFSPDNSWHQRPTRYNSWAWVKPDDIGYTNHRDPALTLRLKKLAAEKILEMRYYGNLPRFRVRRPHLME